jgi:hypothetical protein
MDQPEIHVRWWHSSHGTAHLELLATPSAKISSLSWTKLTRDESSRCEEAWQTLTDEEKANSQRTSPDRPIAATTTVEEGEDELLLGVPIGKERLFEVDVRTMTVCIYSYKKRFVLTVDAQMYPVFWKLSGPPIVVRRVLWMYDSVSHVLAMLLGRPNYTYKNRPVDEPLARQLEDAYQSIKPWKSSYQEEVLAALQVGPAAYEKLKCPLADGSVFFDDAASARLIYNSFTNRVSSAFFSTLRGGKSTSPYPAAPLVYRGSVLLFGG